MLRIIHLEEIQNLLLHTPRFVRMLDKKDADTVPEVKAWLVKIEEALQNNRMTTVSLIAGLRGALISAEKGVLLDSNIRIHGRFTTRKIKEAVAAEVIKRVGEVVMETIQGDNARVAQAEEICQQLIALAKAKRLTMFPQNGMSHTEWLKALWSTLSSEQDIAAGTANIEGLVGSSDSLIILDRTLTKNVLSN